MGPTLMARCFATSLPPASSATKAKNCPDTRSTAVTGIIRPGLVFQTILARTYCIPRRAQLGFGPLLFLFADRAGGVQVLRALRLLPRKGDRCFARGAFGLLAGDRGLLPARIDLHQRRALTDAVARFDEDLRDLAVDL